MSATFFANTFFSTQHLPPPPPCNACRQCLGRYAGFGLGQRTQLQELYDELKDPGASKSAGAADVITLGDAWLAPAIHGGLIQPLPGAETYRWVGRWVCRSSSIAQMQGKGEWMGWTDTCFTGSSSISCIVCPLNRQPPHMHACMHVLPTSMQKDNPFTLSCAFLRWWRHLPPRWQQLMRRDPVTGATSSSGPVWGCPYRWERARGGSRRQRYCTCPFCAVCHLQEVVCCLVDTGIMQRACSSQQGCFCHWSFAAHVRAKVDGAVTYMYDQPANALSPAPPTSWHSQHPAPALSSLSPANLLIWLHRWGANCILYKHDKVTRKGRPILDWPDLLQPQLKGQVAFPTSTREFVGCALKTLGVPGIGWNSTAADLEAAGVSREAARDAVRALRGQAKLFSDNDHVRALQVMLTQHQLSTVYFTSSVLGLQEY